MTAFLYRLGRFAAARRLLVICVWALILVALAVGGFGFGGRLADSFSVPGTESQAALDRLNAVFPQAAGGSAQVLVVDRGGRIESAADKRAIADTVAAIKRIPGVESVSSPFSAYSTRAVSGDKHAAIVSVQFTKPDSGVRQSTIDRLMRTASIGRHAGLAVNFSGQVFQRTVVGVSWTEGLGVLFAGVVLVITFGSLLAAGLPLLSAILGVVLSMAAIRIVALFVDVSQSAPTLALMLGLAVGIDYGLFIISRHRQQLATGMPVAESVATAVATAGTAVAFAGATVIIALLGLLVVGIPFLSIMGVGAAFAVFVAVAASVTLLPAVLALAGERMTPKAGSRTARRALAAQQGEARTMGARWVAGVLKAPMVAVLAVLVVLGVLAIPAADLELSLPNNGSQPAGTGARVAYDTTAKYFGAGRNGPLVLLVDVTQNNDFPTALDRIRSRVAALPGVAAVGKGTPNLALDTAIVQVIPRSGPDDPATVRLVNRIRALEPSFQHDYRTAVQVTGTTAVQIDISTRLGQALLPFGIVVVGLSVILLLAVFRSIFVPIKAAVGFLLSVLASLGVTVAIFQWGWGAGFLDVVPGPLLSFLPVLVMAILFGLSMDYEVFLVSGMREHWVHHRDAKGAIRHGFIAGSRVVTAAALIMIFVFASFIPEGGGTIKPIALALAVGIAFDAFLVRETFVPAAMALFGRAAWYLPRWLDRLLPVVDIEGESLTRRRSEQEWAAGQHGALLSASLLRPDVPLPSPITLEVAAGQVRTVQVPGEYRRAVVATLSGHLAQASGNLQIAGLPGPSHGAELRRLAAPVFDEGGTWRSSLGDLLAERLRYARRGSRRGTADGWLERIRDAAIASGMAAAGEPAQFPRTAPLGAYTADERLLVLSAAALAGGATVLVVDMGDLGRESERLLTAALSALIDESCAAVLVTAPHPDLSNVLPLPNRKAVSL